MRIFTEALPGRFLLVASLVAVLIEISTTRPAAAAAMCGPVDAVIDFLKRKYQEVDIGGGQTGPQTIIRLFASPAGTFTVALIRTDGRACLITAGVNFELTPVTPGNDT